CGERVLLGGSKPIPTASKPCRGLEPLDHGVELVAFGDRFHLHIVLPFVRLLWFVRVALHQPDLDAMTRALSNPADLIYSQIAQHAHLGRLHHAASFFIAASSARIAARNAAGLNTRLDVPAPDSTIPAVPKAAPSITSCLRSTNAFIPRLSRSGSTMSCASDNVIRRRTATLSNSTARSRSGLLG